jgi:anti-sigma B factor antagonist
VEETVIDNGLHVDVVAPSNGVVVMRLVGELDLASGPVATAAFGELLGATTAGHTVLVDLSDLAYCDAAGLNVFVDAERDAVGRGKTIVLARPCPLVRLVFEMVQFGRVVRIDNSSGGTGDDAASAGGWGVSSESS